MKFIDFDYDSVEGLNLNIQGQMDAGQIYFKVFDGDKKVTKGSLTNLDIRNIEAYIIENSEDEINYESDFYERSSD